ncbi:MAG: DUF1778 domain-containing protein [Phycisphaerales bacterium]|jgi:uncharacterized protein (DUF1778 family)|nr:DUF1778 domain-containing protein [Phycisphaerales bacterium]
MSALPNPSSARLDFRVSPEHKSLIERAAMAQGQTVSSFALAALVKASQEVIESETTRTLSERDSRIFLDLLESPPEPNAALRVAAKRHKELFGR